MVEEIRGWMLCVFDGRHCFGERWWCWFWEGRKDGLG